MQKLGVEMSLDNPCTEIVNTIMRRESCNINLKDEILHFT